MSDFSVGIDLGTTNCALASTQDVTPPVAFLIPQLVGAGEVAPRPLLPSFLYRPSDAELPDQTGLPWDKRARDVVGVFARNQGAATPARLVSSAKSWLSFAGADRRAPLLPWQAPEEVAKLSPLEASARYLAHLRSAWDAAHPDAPLTQQDIVLTVPASFDAVARDLTVEAAQLAGLPELRLLEEPQAALYAWLVDRGDHWRQELAVGDVILVIDIGGGTTDLSLIAVREESGVLQLERVAVGDHILLGGDNMDLALAYGMKSRFQALDDWQMRALTHSCRVAKEALLSDAHLSEHALVVPGRGSRLIGGTLKATVSRGELEAILLDGFLPHVPLDARPQAPKRVGLTTLGLPYASDAAVTRHLAAFLGRSDARPTAVLFNGGVTKSTVVRERLITQLNAWIGRPVKVLTGADPDLAVSRGAAYYAHARKSGGVRIRGGTQQAYYVGLERAELAVPGVEPRIDALCIAPFGMEEGSEIELDTPLGLYVGQPVSFRFFGSSTRKGDQVGTVVEPEGLTELAPIETAFAGEADRVAQVKLHARVTEVGTLELSAVEQGGSGQRWKLSFNVRSNP